MFKGLLFEAEAERFRQAGIRVGADLQEVEARLLEETLAPFPIDLRNDALQMARLYALLYCFENSVRQLIKERLQEAHGVDWWAKGVPQKVQKFAEDRQREAVEQSWLEGQKTEVLGFVEFGHLADIIINSWEDFADLVPTQHWLKQRMEELEKARNFVAHHRVLLPSEFDRIEMYVADWNRAVGL
jgi:hypothetical protein